MEGAELPPEIIERLIKRPEDLPAHVVENIRKFKSNMLRILEDYMADFDQQYLIELDANKPVKLIFQVSRYDLESFLSFCCKMHLTYLKMIPIQRFMK